MDNKTLNTVLTILAFVIGIVGLIMGIMIMAGNESMVGPSITLVIIVMGIAAAVAVLFGLFHFFGNIKKNIPLLIGVIVFAILAVVAYTLASDEVLTTYDDSVTAGVSKLSGAGIMVMYALLVVAVIAAVAGEIGRIFK